MAQRRVVVVGAGVGGLVAAALLAHRGFAVTVCERAATPGGKLRTLDTGGVAVDAGPTVFTMRWVFDEIFAACGADLESHLGLSAATTLARHAWDDGSRLDLSADEAASADAIAAFAGPREAQGFVSFMAEAKRILQTLETPFLRGSATTPFGLTARIGMARLPDLFAIQPFARMWDRIGRHFTDPRLRQLFGRYATYSGASPFEAPATLMLIAAVEAEGVWLIDGGMFRLALALEALGTVAGANYRYGCEVAAVEASGITLASGEQLEADAVVVNADPHALATGLFGEAARRGVAPLPPTQRSLSALVWTLDAEVSGFPLLRHNVFFSDDYPKEFADLAAGRLPREPSIYVCAQDRAATDAAPSTRPERLQLIVNAPALGDVGCFSARDIEACMAATFERLNRSGLTLATRAAVLTTPRDFAALFPATGGALYGAATHGSMAAFRRPGARTGTGLYLAGGATHPGAGVPMAALSGIQAATAVLGDLASTQPSTPRAMPGGTSTR